MIPRPHAPEPRIRRTASVERSAPCGGLAGRLGWVLAIAVFVAIGLPAQEGPAEEPAAAAEASEPSDDVLRDRVTTRLLALDGLEEVEVQVEDGVVRLSGEVLLPSLEQEAQGVAEQTDGVAMVVSQIEVIRDPREVVGPVLADLVDRTRTFLAWLPLLLVALAVVGVFAALAGWIGRRGALFRRLSSNNFVQDLWRRVVRTGVFLMGVLIALELLDATALVGAVLGAAGIAGLAIGFAFRNVAENSLAGAMLSFRQPFLPTDHVVIDGWEGKVIRLTPRATILMTLDGNHLTIPNATVFNAVLVNYTRNPKRRFDFTVGVGNEEDLLLAQRLGVETLASIEGVADDPGPSARVEDLGDSSVVIRYYAWVDQREHDFGAVKGESMRLVKTALEEAGMDLPEPIYRLRMQSAESAEGRPAESVERSRPTAGPPPSTEVDDTIDAQIDLERKSVSDDLLSSTGTLE